MRTDRIIAAAAIFMSLLSLAVAYKHGLIMRDLVSANSWPLLQLSSSNYDDARRTLSISVQVENVGVGPAIVREFHVRYAGKRYTNPYELLRACCGYRVGVADSTQISPGAPLVASVEGTVVKAGETRPYISMDLTPENKQAWQRLDSERFKLAVEACYCSVLGDCWRSDLTGLQQNKVKACRVAERPAD